MKRVWNWMLDKADGEWSNGIFWGAAFLLAAYATFYTAEIKDVGEFSLGSQVNWKSTIFTVGFILLTGYSIVMNRSKKQAEKRTLAEIKTIPPSDYWPTYFAHYNAAVDKIESLAKKEKELLANGKRNEIKIEIELTTLLIAELILILLAKWDYSILQGNVTYWAGIMSVQSTRDKNGTSHPILCKSPLSINCERVISQCDQFLVSEKNLCIKYYSGDVSHEPSTKDFILPILPTAHGFNIPGAPSAYAMKQFSYVDDVSLIANNYEKATTRDNEFKREINYYYSSKNNKGKSILSIPVGEDYVISFYRDKPDMLYAGSKAEDFYYIVAPFLLILKAALEYHSTYKNG